MTKTAGLLNVDFTLTASIKGGEGNYEMGKGRDVVTISCKQITLVIQKYEKDVDLNAFIK